MTASIGRMAVRLGLLASLAVAAAGCTTIQDHRGYVVDQDLVDSVQPGIDNRQSVESTLGRPSFISQFGDKLGGGATAPANAVYVRRWSIEPLPSNPNNTLVLQVLVFRNNDRGAANNGAGRLLPEEARLVTVKTRKAQ